MKIIKQLILILLVSTDMSLLSASAYEEGELYLATNKEIDSWELKEGIIIIGDDWFDDISREYEIATLTGVTPWCVTNPSSFYYSLTFNEINDVQNIIMDFETETEVDNAWPASIYSRNI